MTLDINENALSEKDIRALKKYAHYRLTVCRRRAYISIGVFFVNCAVIFLFFLERDPAHPHSGLFGTYLWLVALPVLLANVQFVGVWLGAWSSFRDLKKTYP